MSIKVYTLKTRENPVAIQYSKHNVNNVIGFLRLVQPDVFFHVSIDEDNQPRLAVKPFNKLGVASQVVHEEDYILFTKEHGFFVLSAQDMREQYDIAFVETVATQILNIEQAKKLADLYKDIVENETEVGMMAAVATMKYPMNNAALISYLDAKESFSYKKDNAMCLAAKDDCKSCVWFLDEANKHQGYEFCCNDNIMALRQNNTIYHLKYHIQKRLDLLLELIKKAEELYGAKKHCSSETTCS